MICIPETSFCISEDYYVYAFGNTSCFKSNNDNNICIPILIKDLYDIKMIDCGSFHILCLDFYGNVFSLGNNDSGQLGLGKNLSELAQTSIPQRINIPSCKQIACGGFFSMCLTEKDLLYSFGVNKKGELGLNHDINYNSPQLIPNFYNIEYITCGNHHSICKRYDNTYYGWGSNFYGQIGHDRHIIYDKPTLCNNYPDNIISIKCGTNHTLLLTLEGNIYSFGNNDSGRLGLNDNNIKQTNMPTLITNIPEIRMIECGTNYSMCIDVNDHLWLFGGNYLGQLGLGDKKNRSNPTKHPTLSNIMDISSREYRTFIKTLDGKIYAFGENDYSQLGIKTSGNKQLTPIQVFQDKENIWGSFIGKSKQKSARK